MDTLTDEEHTPFDLDWHRYKLKILSDLDDLKGEFKDHTTKVDETLSAMRADVTILKLKLGIIVAVVSTVISVIATALLKYI